ncbi:MAG: S41 family peptidase [Myxococcales bacterium]|nr:S41 family peptidase [Myxococcales bacterium]
MRSILVAALLMTACARGPGASRSSAIEPTPASVVASESSPELAACDPVAFPESAAGRRLEELIVAVNASDRSAAERFVATAMSASSRARHAGFILGNAGDELTLDLCRVAYDAGGELVAFLGGADGRGGFTYGALVLVVDERSAVVSLGVTPATKEDLEAAIESLDDEGARRIVDDVAGGLAGYVFADKAAAMATKIRAARDAGEYAQIKSGHALAHRLTDDLFAVTGDKHLGVTYHAVAAAPTRPPTPEELERFAERAARDNFGMPIAELREGSVGYLKVDGFLPPEVAGEAMSATMSKLADAEVLVIDLRENGGGSPHGVARMASYLFGEEPVHLNDIYSRREDRTESFHTSPDVQGRRFGADKPIYVLTSAQTFSAGEEFAYDLQAQQRATIVGEVTGGGAHPIDLIRVSDHWTIALPIARSINPITKTNWEGTGVQPDVAVPAEQALEKALELAKQGR